MPDKPRQRVNQTDNWQRVLLKFSDTLAIALGLWMLISLFPDFNSKSTIVISLVAFGIFTFVAEMLGLYRRWHGIAFAREAGCTLLAWGTTAMVLAGLGQFTEYSTELSGASLLLWFTFTIVVSLFGRILRRWYNIFLISKGINTRRFAVVGVNELGIQVVRSVKQTPDLGLQFMGYFDDRPDERLIDVPDDINIKLGSLDTLIQRAKQGDVQAIFIALPMRAEKRIRQLIRDLSDTTASVYVVPDLFVYQMLSSRWTDVQGIPVVSVFENPFYGVDGMLKRSVDIVLATIALLVVGLPMLLIAATVKLTSPGPILFRQLRYGLDGREIRVWKFRSMTVCEDGDQVKQATRNDQRITPIGGFLRKSSLDELPQIFNVLFGDMSLVGPRPHANAHNEFYRSQIEGYMLRHKVKPGITGLAQVNGCRGETETLDKMKRRVLFDHQYIREWSIWLDLKILMKTFAVVFSRQNAY